MRIKKMNMFVKIITLGWPTAICLAPFGIYIKEKYLNSWRIINHESIHWVQQKEMLYIFFYFWYLVEWLIRLFINGRSAYENISFEREANGNEVNTKYIETRKSYSWIKYLTK